MLRGQTRLWVMPLDYRGHPYHSRKFRPGPCSIVWECGKGHTDTQTHRRLWPLYISPRLCLTRNVSTNWRCKTNSTGHCSVLAVSAFELQSGMVTAIFWKKLFELYLGCHSPQMRWHIKHSPISLLRQLTYSLELDLWQTVNGLDLLMLLDMNSKRNCSLV